VAKDSIKQYVKSRARTDHDLNGNEAYVLTRAVLGTLRAAVLEDFPLLKTQAIEDALVRLILGFLRFPSRA
jgi:hypothetical protein